MVLTGACLDCASSTGRSTLGVVTGESKEAALGILLYCAPPGGCGLSHSRKPPLLVGGGAILEMLSAAA